MRAENIRIENIGPAKKKSLGQYFTPEYMADFMISLTSKGVGDKVLEPAAGDGVFLKRLGEVGYKNITAYEVDKSLGNISKIPVKYESFISAELEIGNGDIDIDSEGVGDSGGGFDLIIGNPPYVRWKNLSAGRREELSLSPLWNKYFNSLCDYLYIFILKSVELLKDGGELIFITPEYWIHTKHAQTLRDYMVENGYFKEFYHFSESPIFAGVSSSIIVFRYVKGVAVEDSTQNRIKVAKYGSKVKLNRKILEDLREQREMPRAVYFEIPQFYKGKPWLLVEEDVIRDLERIEKKCEVARDFSGPPKNGEYLSLGDIAEIGNGLVSGLDKAFKLSNETYSALNSYEKNAVLKVVKAGDLSREGYSQITNYIYLNEKNINEETLKTKYPNFYSQLNAYRPKLKSRYNYGREIPYWEWVFLRNKRLFDTECEKIFVPCKERITNKEYIRFTLAPKNIYPTQDVTAIVLKPKYRKYTNQILDWLKTPEIFEWILHKGVVKGGVVEFTESGLERLPVTLKKLLRT